MKCLNGCYNLVQHNDRSVIVESVHLASGLSPQNGIEAREREATSLAKLQDWRSYAPLHSQRESTGLPLSKLSRRASLELLNFRSVLLPAATRIQFPSLGDFRLILPKWPLLSKAPRRFGSVKRRAPSFSFAILPGFFRFLPGVDRASSFSRNRTGAAFLGRQMFARASPVIVQ